MEWSAVTMSTCIDRISRFLDRPVVDMTGLTGLYEIAINARPMSSSASATAGASAQPEASEPTAALCLLPFQSWD
jgi:uncharacterized protein (TIGR03435 family)